MITSRHKFGISDVIAVKPDITDPDFGTDINGWVGTIEAIESDDQSDILYKIRWSQNTLDNITSDLRQACQNIGLDFESMYLLESDVELHLSGAALAFRNTFGVKSKTGGELINEYISRCWR